MLVAALLCSTFSGCATRGPDAVAGSRSGSAPAGPRSPLAAAPMAATRAASTPTPTAVPGTPQPFATVVRGATRHDGLLPLWKREDKVWIELSPQALEQAYFLSPKLATGIGEAGLFGGLMAGRSGNFGRPQVVRLRRVGSQIQMLAENAAYAAREGSEAAYAVTAAFSPSLLGSATVASQPDANGAVLIDAQALFLTDLQGVGMLLQRAYRQGYAFDARNSSITTARASARSLVIEVQGHYASAALSLGGAGGNVPAPGAPATVPDARSLFITTHYTLLALPQQPMAPRLADARVGTFLTTVADYSDERLRTPRRHFVNRWRLDKRDAQAAVSPPVQPIVYWLDRSIPQRYRDTVRAGVLEWNRAFERIGISGAIEVRDQPADGSVDTLEAGQASIRWMTNAGPSFDAIGPSHVDPRSGEILDADIGLESLATRAARHRRAQLLPLGMWAARGPDAQAHETDDASCQLSAADSGLGFALDVATGSLDPDSPEAEAFVHAYLKYLVMHEVGHTLGLRHNFRASTAFDAAQLADPAFTAQHGTSASVMDYVAVNLPLPGRPQPAPYPTTLGAYDLWAIEYAYKPLPADQETAELRRIAQRVQDPAWRSLLAYGNDEDLALGLSPDALPFDLGSDPLAFARQRLALVAHWLRQLEARPLQPDDDAALLRRSVAHAVNELARGAIPLARQIGGVHTRRETAGTPEPSLQPVSATRQRAALDLLLGDFLRPRALRLSGALQQRLSPDYLERDAGGGPQTDFSLTQTVATLQRSLLSQLMSEETTASLLDSQDKDPQAFHLAELHRRLLHAVWLDAPPPGTPASWTRELQREHVNRLATLIVRPGSAVIRAEARSLWLATGRELLALLRGQQAQARDALTREHLRDSADTLARALAAPAVRGAP